MDARQRLNQLRRFKSKSNRNKVKNRQKLNDLREIIVRKDSNHNKTLKTNQNKRISIKSRIGFKTQNNDNRRQRLQIVGKNKRQRIDRKSNVSYFLVKTKLFLHFFYEKQKIVSLSDDQRIPTVVVNFSQMNEIPRNASNVCVIRRMTKNLCNLKLFLFV